GYAAGPGYDQASGLGSVDANNLAAAFAVAAGDFEVATTTKLSATPANPGVGTIITLTANVAAASGTTLPGGSVTFTIDGAAQPASALTNGVATMTTSFSTGGAHLVQVAYSPGTNPFFVSSTAATLIVAASGTAKTTT